LLNGTTGVSIVNNTAEEATGGVVFGGDHDPHAGFVFRDNAMPDNGAGFVGSGTAPGKASIDRYFPNATILGNVFIGGKPELYPPGNFFSRDSTRSAGADMRSLSKIIEEVRMWRN